MGNLQLVVAGLQQDKCRPLAAAVQQGCSTIRITPALPAESCHVMVLPPIARRLIGENPPVAGAIGRVGLSRREECLLIVTGRVGPDPLSVNLLDRERFLYECWIGAWGRVDAGPESPVDAEEMDIGNRKAADGPLTVTELSVCDREGIGDVLRS
jgi:hypothetical protein